MKAAKGRRVAVHYRGTLDSGEEFDSSEGREPLEFVMGGGELVPGFEAAVLGMEPGDEKTVTLAPEDVYGSYEDGLVVEGPRSSFPPKEIKLGQSFTVHLKNGEEAVGRVVRLDARKVIMDFNHPLAGKRLTFHLRIISVGDPPAPS